MIPLAKLEVMVSTVSYDEKSNDSKAVDTERMKANGSVCQRGNPWRKEV
jgi:hypothetical protein